MRACTSVVVILAACGGGSSGSVQDLPPIAHDDHVAIDEDQALEPGLLLANDEHLGCSATIEITGMPQHGVFDPYTTSKYTPDPGFHGTDTFSYTAYSCGLRSNVAQVTVDIHSNGVPYEQSRSLDGIPVTALASGDIDGDGRIDLVVADARDSNVAILVNRTASAGAYAVEPLRFEGGHEPVAIAVADFDGDGRPDVVTASHADGLILLRNITPPGGAVAFDAPIYIAGVDVVGVVAADLDGDGKIDLASIDPGRNTLDVRLNTSSPGTIAFGARTSFGTPDGPAQLASVDADGTGGADLVVLSVDTRYVTEGNGTVSLFVNATALGDVVPSFAARTDRATGQNPTAMFVADLDGDHRPEIGVLDDGLWIYANQSAVGGPPSYEAARVLDVSAYATVVAPADLDGQGQLDLVLGGQASDPFSVLLNKSTPASGFAFDDHESVVGTGKHAALQSVRPTAIQFVELDGIPPAEVVVGSEAGTLVLFGD